MRGSKIHQFADTNESLAEVAQILAHGILRLHERDRRATTQDPVFSETALKTARQDLAQFPETRLLVARG